MYSFRKTFLGFALISALAFGAFIPGSAHALSTSTESSTPEVTPRAAPGPCLSQPNGMRVWKDFWGVHFQNCNSKTVRIMAQYRVFSTNNLSWSGCFSIAAGAQADKLVLLGSAPTGPWKYCS